MNAKQIIRTLFTIGLFGLIGSLPLAAQAATVASITLTTPHTTLDAGVSETLMAVAKDSAKHTVSGVKFTWSSSSTSVLSITSKGVAKGLKPGTSTIKVTGGGKSASVVVTVTAASIALTTPNKAPHIGDEETLTAVAKDSTGHAISGVKFTWKSSKTGIVSITSHGLATALDAGKSTITVTGGGKSATVAITVPTPSALAGVAAKGAAIVGATVTLVDKKGNSVNTTTGVDGGYTLDTTGLKPPFLVSVQIDEDHILYSVSADADIASVVNISPLTDLIVRSWYSVQGVAITAAFADPVTNPPPTPDQVQLISNVVVQVTALWLQQAGVDTSNFSPISTPFTADGSGADQVLDQTTIDPGTGSITITDGGDVTQNSTVSYDTDTGAMSVDSTTTNGTDSSSDVAGTVVATSDDMQAALTGITTALNGFAATVNSKGTALSNTDITSFIDAHALNGGLNKALFADSIATEFRGNEDGAINIAFQVQSIQALDVVNGIATVDFTLTESQGDQSQNETTEFFFKKQSDGSWRLYGDQKVADLSIKSEMRTSQGAFTGDSGPDINVDIRPLQGTYSGITINGGEVFNNVSLDKQGTEVDVFKPSSSSDATVSVTRDEYFANSGVLGTLVAAGTPLTVTLTPTAGGDNVIYTVKTNAFTTESISITNLSGSAIADATLGTPLHVVWTLPTTFAIAQVKLNAILFDGDQTQNTTSSCEVEGLILSTDATSADITIPTTVCGGNATVEANLNLSVTGVNGERESVIYMFKDPTP